MTKTELTKVLDAHQMWLRSDVSGEKASLRGANLRDADFRGASLRGASLMGADFRDANFRDANLSWANLRDADFSDADFRDANLSDADFRGANLMGANLMGANLMGADFRGAKGGSVCRMDFGGWSICIRSEQTSIGRKTYDNADLLEWTWQSRASEKMGSKASDWWRVHGPAVKAAIRVVRAKVEEDNE